MSRIKNGRVRRPRHNHGVQSFCVHEGTEVPERTVSPEVPERVKASCRAGLKPVCLPQCLFSLLILQAPGQLHPETVDKFTILGLTSAVSNKQQI